MMVDEVVGRFVDTVVRAMIVLSEALENGKSAELGNAFIDASDELENRVRGFLGKEVEIVVKRPFKIVDFGILEAYKPVGEIYGLALDRGTELVVVPFGIPRKDEYIEKGEESFIVLGTYMLYKVRDYIEPLSEKDRETIDKIVRETESIMDKNRVFKTVMEAIEPEPLKNNPLGGKEIVEPYLRTELMDTIRNKILEMLNSRKRELSKSRFRLTLDIETKTYSGINSISILNYHGKHIEPRIYLRNVRSGAFETMTETVEYVVKEIIRIYERMVDEGIW